MRILKLSDTKDIVNPLKQGEVGVIPTDTLYGLVGLALNPDTVERIYVLRKRISTKPMIILISSVNDLELFNIDIDNQTRTILEKIWPNPVSVILPSFDPKFNYLDRGTKTLAFRVPNDDALLGILKQTGPLVAPSANFQSEPPALTIGEAQEYFGSNADFYVDQGQITSQPSTVVKINGNEFQVIRQGAFKLP